MTNPYFVDTLPNATSALVSVIQNNPPKFLSDFYLSGGTALSLQIGHRQSEDLDFFTQEKFDPLKLQPKLEQFGKLSDVELADGTLNTLCQFPAILNTLT